MADNGYLNLKDSLNLFPWNVLDIIKVFIHDVLQDCAVKGTQSVVSIRAYHKSLGMKFSGTGPTD